MCDERLWQPVIDGLDPRFIAHYIDLPLGDSIDDIVQSLAYALPNQPINLVGFSLGGYLAAKFTLRYPNRVNRLMLLANSPTKLPSIEVKMREFTLAVVKKVGYSGVLHAKVKQLLAPENRNNSDIISLIKAMDSSGGSDKFMSQISSTTHREALTQSLVALGIPTKFVFGEHDSLVNKTLLLNVSANHIETSVIKNCGHMSPLEQPQTVISHIDAFLNPIKQLRGGTRTVI